MSVNITLFTPQHYFWQHQPAAWFHRPIEGSTGSVGFKVPFLHICFMWGHR